MSTSAVSSSSLNQQLHQYFHTRTNDLQQLGQALSSGDLTGAQSAFSSIVTLGQSGPFNGGNPFLRTQREQDFTAIGNALQSGDLAGAQQAFGALEATFKNAGNQVVPNSNTAPTGPGPEIIINLTGGSATTPTTTAPVTTSTSTPTTTPTTTATTTPTTASTTTTPTTAASTGNGPEIVLNINGTGNSSTPEQVVISIGAPNSSGAEQISLSVGNQGSKTPQEITFNLNSSSNEQIILNLLGASTATSTANTSTAGGALSVSA